MEMKEEKTMSEERKQYEVVGEVKIGTDEYRDLIEDKNEAEKQSDVNLHRAWDAEKQRDELKKKVTAQEKAIARYKKFISMTEERSAAYNLFIAGISEEADV